MGDLEVDVGAADRGGGEDLGETAADVEGPDAAARHPGHQAVAALGNGAVMGVDVPHHVVGHVAGVVAVDPRVDPLAAAPAVVAVRGDEDHLAAALPPHQLVGGVQEGAPARSRGKGEVVGPCPGGAAEAVQDVGDRVAPRLRLAVGTRQQHGEVAEGGIAEPVVFEMVPVNGVDLKSLRPVLRCHRQLLVAVLGYIKPHFRAETSDTPARGWP